MLCNFFTTINFNINIITAIASSVHICYYLFFYSFNRFIVRFIFDFFNYRDDEAFNNGFDYITSYNVRYSYQPLILTINIIIFWYYWLLTNSH